MTDATQVHLSVINEAYLALGGQSLESFSDPENEDADQELEDIQRAYMTIVGAQISHPALGFARQRVQLNRLSASPATGYTYNFTSPVPGDVAALYASATTQTPHRTFRILDGKINTDLTAAWAEILVGSSPDAWPDYVRMMIIACVKAEFAFTVTGDRLLARDLRFVAYGPPDQDPNGGLVRDARQRSGQQQAGGQLTLGPTDITSARYRRGR